jgi:hypothetical protein
MHALQRLLPKLLVLAAAGVVLATLLSDHSAEYGQVTLPRGGVATLPEGTVRVFVDESATAGDDSSDPRHLSAPLRFDVTPVGGGPAVAKDPTTKDGTGELFTTRSQAIGSAGAVANLEVPAEGEYRISGSLGDSGTTQLSFGLDSFMAVLDEWKLLAGLLGGALLIAMIPLPKRGARRDWSGEASGEASPPSAGAYQPGRFDPYRG